MIVPRWVLPYAESAHDPGEQARGEEDPADTVAGMLARFVGAIAGIPLGPAGSAEGPALQDPPASGGDRPQAVRDPLREGTGPDLTPAWASPSRAAPG
ncbi:MULTISPECIES: hypothetical protein [Streptomyces]|uniref:hypothetical protein n=1 Tax=Streptomyces TaxID=1883 RepID=UPI00167A8CEE|nr:MULTISPECIES: hypothetical protein [Streptomyces]MBK3522102.1 hypothetical protein [Streptomyces sp. MBT70]GGS12354.1 hypothetical protein GCM10010236_78570 [Streptomyces eurythermus]